MNLMKIAWRRLCLPVLIVTRIGLSGQNTPVSLPDSLDGQTLAGIFCVSCHVVPEPDLLTKESWQYLLTYMGFFLGVADYSYMEGSSERTMDNIHAREEFVRTAAMFPAQPLLSGDQWKRIREYYMEAAPLKPVPQKAKPAIVEDETLFKVKKTQYRQRSAVTSMVRIDEEHGMVLVHDGMAQRLIILDRDLDFLDRHDAPSVFLVDAEFKDNEVYLLNIGDLFASRIGEGYGEVQYAKVLGGVYFGLKILLDKLHRPAAFDFADLNNDGVEELLVSNFGDYTGNLSLFHRDSSTGNFQKTPEILSAEPGIVKSEACDFDNDGDQDILVMASAARENINILANRGDGSFDRKVIFETHPSFGYTAFVLRDFNNDGRMDILTLNGDNGDSDPFNTLKRDQGLRIYLNRGELDFEEVYFYPMYGVYGAEVEDFDLDGDLDIAAIAFHPDFAAEKPENFVFLQQTGDLEFSPKTHPATYMGRWLTMDSGDLDQDGDKDIILGAGYSPVGMIEKNEAKFLDLVEHGPAILFLDNQAIP